MQTIAWISIIPLQARMPVAADDDVVVHGNAERLGDFDDSLRHPGVGSPEGQPGGGASPVSSIWAIRLKLSIGPFPAGRSKTNTRS